MWSRRPVLLACLLLASGCNRFAAPRPAPADPAVALERETPQRESGGLVLARLRGREDDRRAFVADEDDHAIVEIDLAREAVVRQVAIGARPRDLLVLPDGNLAATLPDESAVVVLARTERGQLREVRRAKLPAEPMSMALSSDDGDLYVTTGASHMLVRLGAATLEQRGAWSLPREPRAALVSADGQRVFVSHAADGVVSIVEPASDAVRATQLGAGGCGADGRCAGPRFARHAQALVRLGSDVLIPSAHAQPSPRLVPVAAKRVAGMTNPKRASVGFTGYGTGAGGHDQRPIAAAIDRVREEDGTRMVPMRAFFEPSRSACLLPRAAVATSGSIVVACVGSNQLEQTWAPTTWPAQSTTSSVTAPSAIAVTRDDAEVIVWSAMSRKISRVPFDTRVTSAGLDGATEGTSGLAPRPRASIDVPRLVPRDRAWLRGRELFFTNDDPRISSDHRACASCHIDGRDDGLTWQTPSGPRRTRLLAGQIATAPYGWMGEHATLEEHVKVTFRQLGGTGLPDDELAALLTYVRSLPSPPSLASSNPLVARGKTLFASAECGDCHAEGGSDRAVHEVGTGGVFMTPSLAGVGARRQLMHDGRFADLDDLVARSTEMGTGSRLSSEDRQSLVAYLRTL